MTQIATIDDTTAIYYHSVSPPIMLVSDRDFVTVENCQKLDNGSYRVFRGSYDDYTTDVPQTDKVRGELFIQITITPTSDTSCQVVTFQSMKPKGSIPGFAVNKMATKQAEAVPVEIEAIEQNTQFEE